ncbi:MAG: hypothetical protein F6K30_09695 [Cyanothece sp. SIO2G6]|nr:hypothetical protein [Cyanothece sp. SIO2G6]
MLASQGRHARWIMMNIKKWWIISNTVSAFFLIVIGGIWLNTTRNYRSSPDRFLTQEATDEYLAREFPNISQEILPTGIFIQSLKFNNSSEVNFTGYLWQEYDVETYAGYDNDDIPVGFVFPEAVESGSNFPPYIAYREIKDNKEVIGWYFETTLKQSFDYSKYPFDNKVAWIRIWSSDIALGTRLVPDFSSYDVEKTAFGHDQNIVLGHWILEETFFNYQKHTYNSNFGLAQIDMERHYPELYFNVVLRRKFLNSFVVNILPLVIIACLIFATLLMITGNPEKQSKLGMNTSGVIGVCSGLFFVVLLSQVQIREEFAGSSIVYVEYFYPLMYVALLGVSVNSYLFSSPNDGNNPILNWINQDDNIHPKLLFWPLLLGSVALITALVLLPESNGRLLAEQEQAFEALGQEIIEGQYWRSRNIS